MKKIKHRILLADSDKDLIKEIKSHKDAKKYDIVFTSCGEECLQKIASFHPELIIVDFMLPNVHGIEILRNVREAPLMKSIGVILTSYNVMVQTYHVAVKMGVNFYLEKPFKMQSLFALIDRFFKGTLTPEPFHEHKKPHQSENLYYQPKEKKHSSYLKFWGTRGSNPVAGVEYLKHGGNTCCLEIKHKDTLVIIDAGTGIRALGASIDKPLKKPYNILFSHTHWDHLLGFPFFNPVYDPKSEVHLWAPVGFDKSSKDLFSEMLAYSYFPVALDDIKSKIVFKDIRDSEKLIFDDITIYTHYSFHPGITLCFRIHIGDKKIGYITDNEFLMGYQGPPKKALNEKNLLKPYESMIEFFQGCDLMIHEAQYLPKEYQHRTGWGHSSVSNASVFIKLIKAPEWIVTHHDPRHTDDDLTEKLKLHIQIREELKHKCLIRMAYDGMLIPI